MAAAKTKQRCLLATMTNEPFQPVRRYYSIPDQAFVTARLRALKCMVEVPPAPLCPPIEYFGLGANRGTVPFGPTAA